jgi:HSP20 family molecular chaperone IbpA
MEDDEIERIKRFLNANGYLVRKSDITWIFNKISAELDRREEENRIVRRDLLCEVITNMKEIKIITELPGVSEDRVKINPCGRQLEIIAESERKRYYELINLPEQADTHKLKSSFLNGFLEVTLKRNNKRKKRGDSRIDSCQTVPY